jgi:NADH-quinone oxidoreductase subunit M
MPVLAGLFLFVSFSSAGLPMLNGFVGEFLILAGTFERHTAWAAYAAVGVILSSVYLLWAYQRVFFGGVTQETNRTLPDADGRERVVLFAMAAMILWMGIGSVAFTGRTEASARNILELMHRPQAYNARAGYASTWVSRSVPKNISRAASSASAPRWPAAAVDPLTTGAR